MDLSKPTDYQLYELIQNVSLDRSIREPVKTEFNRRELNAEEMQKIVIKHRTLSADLEGEPLAIWYKLFLLFFPFLLFIQVILASEVFVRGSKKKWKEFWFYITLGYLLWAIALVLLAKYFLFVKP